MRKKIIILVISLFSMISCSVNDSDSTQTNIIKGTVSNASGVPVQNLQVYVIHIADSPTKSVDTNNISAFPNPFSESISIYFEILEPQGPYVLKAVNLDSMEEIEIFNDDLVQGFHAVSINFLEQNFKNGIYRVYDNIGNEVDIFIAPDVKTVMNFNGLSQPKTAGYVSGSGYLIGKTVATTDNEGKFSFSKDDIFFIDDPHTIIRSDETGLELDRFSLSTKVNVVAYFDENNYSFKEIDLKQNKSHNLELIISN